MLPITMLADILGWCENAGIRCAAEGWLRGACSHLTRPLSHASLGTQANPESAQRPLRRHELLWRLSSIPPHPQVHNIRGTTLSSATSRALQVMASSSRHNMHQQLTVQQLPLLAVAHWQSKELPC
jgi:hypothetical protein